MKLATSCKLKGELPTATTEVALMAHAKSEVGLNTAGSSPQPQLDEAVRLDARSRQRVDARFGGTVNVARDNSLRRMKMAIS